LCDWGHHQKLFMRIVKWKNWFVLESLWVEPLGIISLLILKNIPSSY
jgi:hypothetical protein